jgi:hypothetical protein
MANEITENNGAGARRAFTKKTVVLIFILLLPVAAGGYLIWRETQHKKAPVAVKQTPKAEEPKAAPTGAPGSAEQQYADVQKKLADAKVDITKPADEVVKSINKP